jgi:hypothetical protein
VGDVACGPGRSPAQVGELDLGRRLLWAAPVTDLGQRLH